MATIVPFVSIIVPCYQEGAYIRSFLDSVVSQRYSKDRLEVIIADGLSNDQTRSIIHQFILNYPYIKLVDNPRFIQTFGLNIALANSVGEIVIRMDVHASYPEDYVASLVSAQQRLGAWNVGCLWETKSGADTVEAFVVASVLSSPFGVGNAYYRIGIEGERLVDTVPFGCFPRSVFEKIGVYNETFFKNEDDELNARITKAGGKIYLLSKPIITYFARENITKLKKMLYQYGYFKPQVNFSIGKIISIRQLIPPTFALYCLSFPLYVLLSLFISIWFVSLFVPIILYFILLLVFSLKLAFSHSNNYSKLRVFILSLHAYSSMHFSYGIGFVRGLMAYILKKEPELHLEQITR